MSGRVFILTTEGPVEIQSILEEVPGVRSVVCVNGRAEALPISNAYNAFVRQPTGLIERITGHDSYWMDVSDRIEEGQSWQLGAYIAHVATEQGDLNKDVYATGEVAHDGTVRPVAFVDRKLAALSQLGNAVILVPADTAPQMAEAGGARVVEIASVGDALAAVGLLPPEIRTAKKKSFTGSERMQTLKGLALATVIAACFFWLGIEPARWGRCIQTDASWIWRRNSTAPKVSAKFRPACFINGCDCGDRIVTTSGLREVYSLRPRDSNVVRASSKRAFP